MRKYCVSLLFFLASFIAIAQTPAQLKFLGIPVDGRKSDFITALKAKGFVYDAEQDVLV